MVSLKVPDLGEGIDTVEVVAWHAAEGDRVKRDDDIVELVTDKAVFNVQAPVDGVLQRVVVPVGSEAGIGSVLGEIEE